MTTPIPEPSSSRTGRDVAALILALIGLVLVEAGAATVGVTCLLFVSGVTAILIGLLLGYDPHRE